MVCTGLLGNTPASFNLAKSGHHQYGATGYYTDDAFHNIFTAATHLNVMIYKNTSHTGGQVSMTLNQVLDAVNNPIPANLQPSGVFTMGDTVSGFSMAAWFVAALLGSAEGLYGSPAILKTIGPDPSVRGIEDEYARTNGYQYAAGKPAWDSGKIVQYFVNPWSFL